uniref:Uncharacterized protein C20orf85 homolog isoform X1 n=1 Tax=Petromyzon marinus TaxID=7757 RepID=A0AAJ7XBF1_PETMA|nr:uncharacterized protein C20orf85 homolog isoform X1 [Petromyzon marinus]
MAARVDDVGQPRRDFVAQDEIWKRHVNAELEAAKRWPNTWGFLTASPQESRVTRSWTGIRWSCDRQRSGSLLRLLANINAGAARAVASSGGGGDKGSLDACAAKTQFPCLKMKSPVWRVSREMKFQVMAMRLLPLQPNQQSSSGRWWTPPPWTCHAPRRASSAGGWMGQARPSTTTAPAPAGNATSARCSSGRGRASISHVHAGKWVARGQSMSSKSLAAPSIRVCIHPGGIR